jgi:hypothetical protein
MSTPTTTRYTIHVAVPGHVQGVLAAVGLTSLLTILCTTRLGWQGCRRRPRRCGAAAAAASFVTCKSVLASSPHQQQDQLQQLGGGFAAVWNLEGVPLHQLFS